MLAVVIAAFGALTFAGCISHKASESVDDPKNNPGNNDPQAITVAIAGGARSLSLGASVVFQATVSGSADAAVIWTTSGGTIQQDGTYTAPNSPGQYQVTATAHASPGVAAHVTVTVTAAPPPPPPPSGETSGSISFHLALPSARGETYSVTPSQVDLLMSELVSGAMLAQLIHEHRPAMKLNRDYLYGSLIGQLLQENLQPDYHDATQDWIDTDASQRAMLLTPGQGGPYQLNDYPRELESGLGLVNFIMLQQGLGYTVADQTNGIQNGRIGPDSLENKYFGPMAAAFFHYDDLLRVETLASAPWYPMGAETLACFASVEAGHFDYFDMVLNSIYNAGNFSSTYQGYATLCAHATDPAYASKLANINNYSLDPSSYVAATGIDSGGTFVLYPRQIRNYLDQFYNIDTHLLPVGTVVVMLDMPNLRHVFERVFSWLGIKDPRSGAWRNITTAESTAAFDAALARAGLAAADVLNYSVAADRAKLFDLLDDALGRLRQSLGVHFSDTATVNLALGEGGGQSGGPSPCPTDAPVYPAGRGTYVSGTVVKASDGQLYQCKPNVAPWCNSTTDAYAPATGWAAGDAWTLFTCP